ncbi:monovalent cation:proton antiporter family protein [Candidatus Ichthyocystis hellenicum]|uniref:monovalent cation:proton antiporter family protein n=1 Tax=Candidatus Ichthyocystis hellenicum TaxID=1561003 RepID=UPI000B8A0BB9|nr:monovalent cation:proton antiporter family protein [Candidatus Ichthyocystis hellenicum]
MVGLGFFVSIVGGLVVSVTLARRFNLPAMIGYLIVGILLSGILKISLADANVLKELAEFGIALLLFTMGLEFSLEKLRSIQRLVFQVGLTQVLLVAVLTFCLCFMILELSWQSSLLMSFMFSMSSTAIVGKMLVERGVVHSAHGYEVLGIALFQDIAIVPMLIILSALSESGPSLAVTISLAMAKSVFVLAVVLRWGRPVMHKWFDIVSRGQSHELFLLNIFFVSMGLSYLMIFMNLPMELGAFLAGMLLSDTEYQCQVEEDISPFRDILLGIFFVTLGMNLDLSILAHNFPIVLAIVITLMVLKGIVTALVSYIFSRDLLTASKTGVWLCSAGEFSFVMLAIGQSTSLVDPDLEKILIVSMVLSMILVTILIQYSHRFMDANFRVAINIRESYLAGIIEKSQSQNKHVIVIGFGQHGQFICRVFEEESVPYTAIDINEDVVRSANTYSGLVIHGEPSIDLLQAAGLDRASALVIAFPGCAEACRIIEEVRNHNEEIPIISRVSLMIDISRILEAGASEVVPEVLETSLLLLTHAMTFSGLPMFRVRKMVNRVRAKNYALIYSFFGGSGDGEEPLSWWQCSLPEGSASIGLSLDELGFFKGGISVRSIQRGTDRIMSPEKDFKLQANDVLIVLGPEKNRADYVDKGFLIDI